MVYSVLNFLYLLHFLLLLTAVYRGSGPLQLSGMTDCSVTNGVPVWRPLLAHTKDDIYDFAHRYGVEL